MTATHGCTAVFKLDNAAGALTDITAYLNNASGPRSRDSSETSTFGKDAKTRVSGLMGSTISIGGPWDATVDAIVEAARLKRAAGSFEWGPQGSTGGLYKLSGECICTSYSISAPHNDVASWTAEFTIDGTPSEGVWP